MRFIITLITSLILLIPASGQGQWEVVELEIPTAPFYEARMYFSLNDIQFVDQDKGFMVGGWIAAHGDYGLLYKTEDGGKTWKLIYENSEQGFKSIHFINEFKGYMIGWREENMLSSSDGGYSWDEDTTLCNINNMFFLNDSVAWTRYSEGIFKTMDGGENWNYADMRGYPSITKSMFFIDEETGWAVGDNGSIVKYNVDYGWRKKIEGIDLPLNKVFFIDSEHGWIAGGYSNNDGFKAIFLKTEDGGNKWTKFTSLNLLINDFHFENKDHGWAVGWCKGLDGWNRGGIILETFNGGIDWEVLKDSLRMLNTLYIGDGFGWAVGLYGEVLKYDPTATGINEENKTNSGNDPLFQNYPNPFQSRTIISYQLPAISDVELCIYDISGRKVATLVNETQQPDTYDVEWKAEGMESGIYFCEFKTGQGRQVMKMILID